MFMKIFMLMIVSVTMLMKIIMLMLVCVIMFIEVIMPMVVRVIVFMEVIRSMLVRVIVFMEVITLMLVRVIMFMEVIMFMVVSMMILMQPLALISAMHLHTYMSTCDPAFDASFHVKMHIRYIKSRKIFDRFFFFFFIHCIKKGSSEHISGSSHSQIKVQYFHIKLQFPILPHMIYKTSLISRSKSIIDIDHRHTACT